MDSRDTWWLWAAFERWLAALAGAGSAALFGGFLVWFTGWSIAVGAVLRALASPTEQADLAVVAGRLMPAIGTLFALLTAFVITNQWNRSRDAERVIEAEADASIRLALASGSPRLAGAPLRGRHLAYLRSVLEEEWPTLADSDAGRPETVEHLMVLQREVRDMAGVEGVSDAVASELSLSASEVATTRRDRLGLAGHGLPAPLFLLTVVAGVVLCIGAVSLAVTLDSWVAAVVGGLVVTVALDLALVVAISDPFRGSMRVVPRPLRAVCAALDEGQFGAWEIDGAPGTAPR
jgi:hypothetical protein